MPSLLSLSGAIAGCPGSLLRWPAWPGLQAWWLATLGPPAPPADATDDPFGQALEACAQGRWSQAYAVLATLADAGHPEAGRLALQMARHGQRLFGLRCQLPPARRARWAALAGAAALPGGATAPARTTTR
jgi:hypothetical protein